MIEYYWGLMVQNITILINSEQVVEHTFISAG